LRTPSAYKKIIETLQQPPGRKESWRSLLQITGLSKSTLSKNLYALQMNNTIEKERDSRTGTPYYRLNPSLGAIRVPPNLYRLICKRREKREAKWFDVDEDTLTISRELLKRINASTPLLDLVVEAFFVQNLWTWYRYLEFFLKPRPSRRDSRLHHPVDLSPPLLDTKTHLSGFESVEEIYKAARNYMLTWTYETLRSEGFDVSEEQVEDVILNLRDREAYSIERRAFYQIQVYENLLELNDDNMKYLDSMLRDLLRKISRTKATVGRAQARIVKGVTPDWLCYRVKYLRQRSANRKKSFNGPHRRVLTEYPTITSVS